MESSNQHLIDLRSKKRNFSSIVTIGLGRKMVGCFYGMLWATHFVPRSRSGCKNSGKNWWMMKFLNAETHTQVLLMDYLQSLWEVGIWVNTVFMVISLRTEVAKSVRGPKLTGPRAEDAMTEPYLMQKNCESRNNHRYAVVVQDLATQWIQSYPCKTKTSQGTQKSLQKFLEPDRKPKVIYTDNSLEFGKACEDLSWNHCTSTPHRSETNGIAERAVRRVKEGTSAVLLQSGLDEKWWADSTKCCCHLRNVQDLLAEGKTPGPTTPFGAMVEYNPISVRDQSRLHQFGKKSITRNLSRVWTDRGWILERRHSDCGSGRIGKVGRIRKLVILEESTRKKCWYHKKGEEFIFPIADGTAKLSGRAYEFREPALRRE